MKQQLSLVFIGMLFSIATTNAATIDEQSMQNPLQPLLNATCYQRSATFEPTSEATIKTELNTGNPVFFVQEDSLLPSRIFSSAGSSAINYTITNVSGATEGEANTTAFVNDGNPNTDFTFDPYSPQQKEMVIDAGELLKAGLFRFDLSIIGNVIVDYSVSQNGTDYIRVPAVNDYDLRYIRLRFENRESQQDLAMPVAIREITLTKPGNETYLVKPASAEPITAYTNYRCKNDEAYQKAITEAAKLASNAEFSIDAQTPTFELALIENPAYENDFDDDGIANNEDNCVFTANADQADSDADFVGDACDFEPLQKNPNEIDSDSDGVGNMSDNCPRIFNPRQLDSNANGRGDACSDDDADGVLGHRDNCPQVSNRDQADVNVNGVGDACEFDKDEDGVFDAIDNCIITTNPEQSDQDSDGIGDACDNCELYNPTQVDADGNDCGDRCDADAEYRAQNDEDEDGVLDMNDNCPNITNSEQEDADNDGVGDACDNCAAIQNSDQTDDDENGVGDFCEDTDDDGIIAYQDNCPSIHNPNQSDVDNDGTGDVCEDEDHDRIPAAEDNCPLVSNADQKDTDDDGVGDKCDDTDDRLLESNRTLIIAIIVAITLFFFFLIFGLIKKIKQASK
jgi:hypothetical protein